MNIRMYFGQHRWLRVFFYVCLAFALFFITLQIIFRPSHGRNWELGQESLPYIQIDTENVTVSNFRNFDWEREESTTEPRYETRTFSLEKLDSVDVFISHFDPFEGLAHIFISFGFGGEHMVVSLETRREVGESFSPTLGILRQFEIMYVVGSEEDIVGLRTDVRDERVYLYPTKASKEQARALFLRVVGDINGVFAAPRMYNTLTHNCTNELTRRVEEISNVRFPLTWKTILPGYFDEVLYEVGVIDTTQLFFETKLKHLISNTSANRHTETYSSDLRTSIIAD